MVWLISFTMNSTDHDSIMLVIGSSALVIIFTIGCFLQVKLIKAVKEEKAMTWDINLSHSITMIIHFFFTILIDTITYIIPNLKMSFGVWFCYFLLFLWLYGISEIVFHSLFISAYKYIFIILNEGVRSFGQEKIKKILFWLNMSLPVFFAFTYIIRPNNLAFNTIHSCGLQEDTSMSDVVTNETIGTFQSRVLFCGLPDEEDKDKFAYLTLMLTRFICFGQTVALILVLSNILEMFFYVLIFRHMKR